MTGGNGAPDDNYMLAITFDRGPRGPRSSVVTFSDAVKATMAYSRAVRDADNIGCSEITLYYRLPSGRWDRVASWNRT
jgi:hypothetical protein